MSHIGDTSIPCHLWLGGPWLCCAEFGGFALVTAVTPPVPAGWERRGWVLQGGGCSGEGQRWGCSSAEGGVVDGVSVPVVQSQVPDQCSPTSLVDIGILWGKLWGSFLQHEQGKGFPS